jgi:hypothetical protein
MVGQWTLKRPPREWEQITGTFILDADGWDRKNFTVSWSTPITLDEFRDRAAMSTVRGAFRVDAPTPIGYANTMDNGKALLREKIETKIEEYKESRESHYAEHSTEGIMAYLNDTGIMTGLRIALDLLDES